MTFPPPTFPRFNYEPVPDDRGLFRVPSPTLGSHLDIGVRGMVTSREAATLVWTINGDRDVSHYRVRYPMHGESDRDEPCNEAGVIGGVDTVAVVFSIVHARFCYYRRDDRMKVIQIDTLFAEYPPSMAVLLWRSTEPIREVEIRAPGCEFHAGSEAVAMVMP